MNTPQWLEPGMDTADSRASDIPEKTRAFRHQDVLLREFSHRMKNMLAVIQSIVRQTLRSTPDPLRFHDVFLGRMSSLFSTYSILDNAQWSGTEIEKVIEHQLLPLMCNEHGRLKITGSSVFLSADVATQLGLVLHELGTNAIKFGALSDANGYIEIKWEKRQSALYFTWCEYGGPPAVPTPGASGFGSRLIDMSVRDVERSYEPHGLQVSFTLALFAVPDLPARPYVASPSWDASAIEAAENEGMPVGPDREVPKQASHSSRVRCAPARVLETER
ncbi:MAG: sensor histidine kinase [Alphaproteobacteria bacterium]|nr:sensor histidine kinase [Alphaproteobacteria bacterium]